MYLQRMCIGYTVFDTLVSSVDGYVMDINDIYRPEIDFKRASIGSSELTGR